MKKHRKVTLALLGAAAIPLFAVLLFLLNGIVFCAGTTPLSGVAPAIGKALAPQAGGVRLMAFNIAKCFVYEGGWRFADRSSVQSRLDQLAAIIRAANPDIVCLSEAVRECGPCDVDQVRYLAERTSLTNWSFGECFSFGLPFYRIASGNAILSRYPVRPLLNIDLVGRKPFYVTKNTRRALAASVATPQGELTVWSLHNDSFNLSNNLQQVRQILAHPASERAFMAGDFNARPTDASMVMLQRSGRFAGVFDGPFTFPADAPTRTIDFTLAPVGYSVVEHAVITNSASDHCAVVTTFARNQEASNKPLATSQ